MAATEVLNTSLESGLSGWTYDGAYWSDATDDARTGTHSLKCVIASPTTAKYAEYELPLPEVGAWYDYSFWFKTNSGFTGRVAAEICFYTAGGYQAGYNGVGYRTGNDATHIGWMLNTREQDAASWGAVTKVTLRIWITAGYTGTVWIDDVVVNQWPAHTFRTMIRRPNYRGTIYSGDSRTVNVGLDIVGSSARPLNTLKYSINMLDDEDNVVATIDRTGITAADWIEETIDTTGFAAGDYTIVSTLKLISDSSVIQTETLDLTISASAYPTNYIDSNNRWVRTTPVFPVGIYVAGAYDAGAVYANLAGGAFNLVMRYATQYMTQVQIEAEMTAAAAQGCKSMLDLACYNPGWGFDPDLFEMTRNERVAAFKTNANLAGWYTNDESGGLYRTSLQEHYDYIRANDPNHPIWQTSTYGQNIELLIPSADMVGPDYYVLNSGAALSAIGTYGLARWKNLMGARCPLFVLECSSYTAVATPTLQQMCCEAWQALCRGCRALMFYELRTAIADGVGHWTDVLTLSNQLYAIRNIAVGTDSAVQVTSSNANVLCITRTTTTDTYILAVNPTTGSITPTFSLGANTAISIESAIPGAAATDLAVAASQFTDTIESYGVRCYRLVQAPPGLPNTSRSRSNSLPCSMVRSGVLPCTRVRS
jgi:hypothetical protein